MHSYLRAVGFSKLKNRSEIRELIRDVVKNYDEKTAVEEHPDGVCVEFSKYYGCDCGVTVCGQYDEDNRFHVDYYFPFFRGTGVTTQEQVTVEKHLDKESYAGACDDLRIGITLIFYLQNAAEYLVEHYKGNLNHQPLTLSGLASEGRILFPALKDKESVKVDKEITKNRSHLIAAARNGDEEAMESLTMEDMDTYSMISRRIADEDVFSIVSTYFMPYGVECDLYSIMGEILNMDLVINEVTREKIMILTLDVNEMIFDVCIPKANILGEPAVGRRFRTNIWLQGKINFPEGT